MNSKHKAVQKKIFILAGGIPDLFIAIGFVATKDEKFVYQDNNLDSINLAKEVLENFEELIEDDPNAEKNFYEILGIERNATDDDIRKAF